MSGGAFEFENSQPEAESSSEDNKRKRKKSCSCKGNNSCATCGEEEYVDSQEEEESKEPKRRPRKTARMSTGKPASSDPEKLARQLKDQSARMNQLYADLRTAHEKQQEAETKLRVERKLKEEAFAEQKRLEAETERLELEAQTAREAKGLHAPVCSVCTVGVNPSSMVSFPCGHSLCVKHMQDHLRRGMTVTKPSCLPRKIEVTSTRAKCPICRVDTGVSYTHGAILLSYPAIDIVTATGFPYIKPQLTCECKIKPGTTTRGIMEHQVFCPEVPICCPFWNDSSSTCEIKVKARPNTTPVGIALRAHFETECQHLVTNPDTKKKVPLCQYRSSLKHQLMRRDLAAIAEYEICMFALPEQIPPPSSNASAFYHGIGTFNPAFKNKTCKQITDTLFGQGEGRIAPQDKESFFPHRDEPYFQDAYLADPGIGASVVVHRQPDVIDILAEDTGDEDDFPEDAFPEVKMAGAPAPMEMDQKVRGFRVILREMNNGIVVRQAVAAPAAAMEGLDPFALPPHLQMPAPPAVAAGADEHPLADMEALQADIDAVMSAQ